ncbi:nuclease-related domain-containing protein [Burkholderia cenocepacia]|uniref:nuclease-related domain-containing protein n=1 Tax=Burkholderia cenocepacia TaxID=95486 RepID=UPI0038413F6B
MLIKSADDKEALIRTLEAIKRVPGLSAHKRMLVEQELRTTIAGVRGEADTAYEIEFYLGESQNTMILHDLRFELEDGRSAQIDHLLIHRTGKIWVLESKRVAKGIKITEDGEFLRWNGRAYDGMASPLEQNRRHVEVLRAVLRQVKSSFEIRNIHSYVVVSSKARIDRPRKGKFDTALIVKADQFLQNFEKDLTKIGFFDVVGALIASGGHKELAQELVTLHRPIEFDYAARFDVPREAIERQLNPTPATIVSPAVTDKQAESAGAPKVAAAPKTSPDLESWPDDHDPDIPADRWVPPNVGGTLAGQSSPAESVMVAQSASSEAGPQPSGDHRCRHCRSTALMVTYGQYGYYFKCQDCEGNTPIKVSCGHDGHKERIRKEGEKFYRECAACDSSRLFYVNGR